MITNLALQPNSSKGSRFQSCRFPGCFHSGLSPPPHLETQQGLLLYVRCKNVLVPGLVGAQLWQTLLPLNTIWHYLVCSPLICSSMLQRSSSAPVTGHFWSHLFFRIHNFKCQDVSSMTFYYSTTVLPSHSGQPEITSQPPPTCPCAKTCASQRF